MKYFFILLILQLWLTKPAHSQTTAFYLSTGYNIPTTTSVIGYFHTENSVEVNSTTYAKGFIIQGGYQLIVSSNFVFDLNINYLFGIKDKIYQTYSPYSGGTQLSYSNSNFSVAPSVCLKFNVGILSPYTKFGFSVNFIHLNQKWETENIFATTYKREYSYKSDFTLGLMGGIGIDFLIDQTFSPYIEAQLNSITYYPDEVELTEFDANGTKSKTTYQLVDKIDESNSSGNVDLTSDFPYSSIGFFVGIKMVL